MSNVPMNNFVLQTNFSNIAVTPFLLSIGVFPGWSYPKLILKKSFIQALYLFSNRTLWVSTLCFWSPNFCLWKNSSFDNLWLCSIHRTTDMADTSHVLVVMKNYDYPTFCYPKKCRITTIKLSTHTLCLAEVYKIFDHPFSSFRRCLNESNM